MKRINILLSIVIAALFVACSKPSLKDVAIERSKMYFNTYDRFVNVDFSSDSICVINRHATFVEDEDSVGTPSEYYIMWTTGENSKLVECYYEISTERDFLVNSTFELFGKDDDEYFKNEQKSLRMWATHRDDDVWKEVK